MLNKLNSIRDFFKKSLELQADNFAQAKELEWAHVYRDSIRGKDFLENLGLNVGRWAGNYSFFYILNRILGDYEPKRILEFGLGESSKFISAYLSHQLKNSSQTVVEHDEEWIQSFSMKFQLSKNSTILHLPLQEVSIKSYPSFSYQDNSGRLTSEYDLFVVDGPFGSDRYSRFDIVGLVNQFSEDKEFIILMDDTHRKGELETVGEICRILTEKGIIHFIGHYSGNKQNTVIASARYRFSTSF